MVRRIRRVKRVGKRKLSKWQVHVKKTMGSNKGMSFGSVLKKAKKSYRK